MVNVTMTDDLFLRSTFARGIAGFFTWAALIITSYQVIIHLIMMQLENAGDHDILQILINHGDFCQILCA